VASPDHLKHDSTGQKFGIRALEIARSVRHSIEGDNLPLGVSRLGPGKRQVEHLTEVTKKLPLCARHQWLLVLRALPNVSQPLLKALPRFWAICGWQAFLTSQNNYLRVPFRLGCGDPEVEYLGPDITQSDACYDGFPIGEDILLQPYGEFTTLPRRAPMPVRIIVR
jgi:hypothetical protein